MDKKDRDIIDKIKQETHDVKIPDSLKPEAMEQKLEDKKVHWFSPKKLAALAAVLALVLIAGVVYNGRITDDNKADKAVLNIEALKTVKDYKELYDYMAKAETQDGSNSNGFSLFGESSGEKLESAVNESASDSAQVGAAAPTGASESSYSETNLRQAGVDEGDIVKTDGRYLYVLKNNRDKVAIVDTKGDTLENIAVVEPEEFSHIVEFYINEDRLIIVGSSSPIAVTTYDIARDESDSSVSSVESEEEQALAVSYDIADKESPMLLGNVSQSGFYQSSRIVDGYLYMFSSYSVYYGINRDKAETYVPKVNQKIMAETDIYMPVVDMANNYTIITAMSLDEPDIIISSKALLSQYGQYYVSNDNIYYYEEIYENGNRTKTKVRKLSCTEGEINGVAQGEFNGYLNDSFSIDEYDGNLRVVTTDGDMNCLYILDANLEIIGKIEDLAKDERVYSARLMGDTGYFVTFRETDPLFSVDLSKPKDPRILGALKIPGFSEYLHPYGDGKLLGVGMEVEEDTGVSNGIKLSMFDITDPEDVTESSKLILETDFYADMFYNYKGFMADTDRNIFGFSTQGEDGLHYNLFTYDKNSGFKQLMKAEVTSSGYMETRGILIDDILYVVNGNIIESYSLDNYEKLESIIL